MPPKWMDLGEMVSYLSNVDYLYYNIGALIEDLGTFSYKSVVQRVEAYIEENQVVFTDLGIF